MRAIICRPQSDTLIISRVCGTYLDNSIYDHILSRLMSFTSTGDFARDAGNQIQAFHQTLVSKGLENAYMDGTNTLSEGGWFRLCCEILVLHQDATSEWRYCQIGTIAGLTKDVHGLRLAIPLHNISEELSAGTIEDSCLAPFSSRSQEELSKEIGGCGESKIIEILKNMPSDKFQERIGHIQTRVVGYYPKCVDGQPWYSDAVPQPSFGTILTSEFEEFVIQIRRPISSMVPYDRRLIESACQTQLDGPLSELSISPFTVLDDGSILVLKGDNLSSVSVFSSTSRMVN